MKSTWIICIAIFSLLASSFLFSSLDEPIFPIFDEVDEQETPQNFRLIKDYQAFEGHQITKGESFNLPISGSGQFSTHSFLGILEKNPSTKIVVVDLRQESHGFINGKAVSWTDGKYNWANEHKTDQEIAENEKQLLQRAAAKGVIWVMPKNEPANGQNLEVYQVQTEREFIESLGLEYVRIPVQDHCPPSGHAVDQFVHLVSHLPSDAWLHLHCRKGRGRTTMFLVLYDMMQNARYASVEDILARHKLIGGTDLLVMQEPTSYKYQTIADRLNFIKQFYQYCQQVPDFQMTWSEWISQQATGKN